jgi:hypothetical protein
LGTAFITFISGFRALAAGLVASGMDPKAINDGFESEASLIWLSGLLLYNFCFMFAWIIAGVAIMRKKIAPWVGRIGFYFVYSIPYNCPSPIFQFGNILADCFGTMAVRRLGAGQVW